VRCAAAFTNSPIAPLRTSQMEEGHHFKRESEAARHLLSVAPAEPDDLSDASPVLLNETASARLVSDYKPSCWTSLKARLR